MVWPTVTELQRRLEPTTGDTFVQDLNEIATRQPRTESS
jgi:hypothetical protein